MQSEPETRQAKRPYVAARNVHHILKHVSVGVINDFLQLSAVLDFEGNETR